MIESDGFSVYLKQHKVQSVQNQKTIWSVDGQSKEYHDNDDIKSEFKYLRDKKDGNGKESSENQR